jgi:hypothetical protein
MHRESNPESQSMQGPEMLGEKKRTEREKEDED